MSDHLTAEQFKQPQDRSAVAHSKPQDDHAARLRGHLRAMAAYYDMPRENVDHWINITDLIIFRSIAEALSSYARFASIPEGPANFYIRQLELSNKL